MVHSPHHPTTAAEQGGALRFRYCVFGPVAPGAQTIRYVDVVNTGQREADFQIVKRDPMPFTIEPSEGRLGPADSDECFLRLKVAFESSDIGMQRCIADVKVNGKPTATPLDMSANVVRQQLEIVSPEGAGRTDLLQFGTVFVGERRTQHVLLVNDGPEPTQFSLAVPKQDGIEYDEPVWSVTPARGTLAPLEQLLLTCVFHPPLIAPQRGYPPRPLHPTRPRVEPVRAASPPSSAVAAGRCLSRLYAELMPPPSLSLSVAASRRRLGTATRTSTRRAPDSSPQPPLRAGAERPGCSAPGRSRRGTACLPVRAPPASCQTDFLILSEAGSCQTDFLILPEGRLIPTSCGAQVHVTATALGGVEEMSATVKLTGRGAYPRTALSMHSLEFIKTPTNGSDRPPAPAPARQRGALPVPLQGDRVPSFLCSCSAAIVQARPCNAGAPPRRQERRPGDDDQERA
jgi:hypothetical protein